MRQLVSRVLLVICAFNVAASGFAHAHEDDEGRVPSSQVSVTAAHQHGDADHDGACDDEGCPAHQCHFGHCQFSLTNAATRVPAPTLEHTLGAQGPRMFQEVYLTSPIKPPSA
jgi:hypothetical protein